MSVMMIMVAVMVVFLGLPVAVMYDPEPLPYMDGHY